MISIKTIIVVVMAILPFAAGDCGPWIALNITTLPPALPSDKITIKYLVAPLLECDYGDDAWWIDAFHGGFSLKNERTGFLITLNFDASPSFTQAIIPTITKFPNGTVDLQWENRGRVFIYAGENDTYWDEAVIPLGVMNGTAYNSFMKWIGNVNASNPHYNIWSVWTDWPGKPLMPNYECFAWVWDAFELMHELGAIFDPKVRPRQSFVALYSDSVPQKVDEKDPEVMNDIVEFYEVLEAKINTVGVLGLLAEFWDIVMDGDFYIRKDDGYYHVALSHFPYFGTHYTVIPLPWQTSQKAVIN